MSGRLILCGTPIGNLDDLSPRALKTIAEAGVLACEDTRRTRKLLTHFGLHVAELVSYHEANERRQADALLRRIHKGERVVVVSDAGMPGLSDPGFRLVKLCADAGIPIEVVPGPNAAVTALAGSGLAPGRFVFEGFLPRKAGERARHIEELVAETRTLVFYESPHRVEATVAALLEGLGDRPAALARELTKLHEEYRRGTLSQLLDGIRSEAPRGEIVLVVAGAVGGHRAEPGSTELAGAARALMARGHDRKEAMREVARRYDVSKRKVFDALLEDGGNEDGGNEDGGNEDDDNEDDDNEDDEVEDEGP